MFVEFSFEALISRLIARANQPVEECKSKRSLTIVMFAVVMVVNDGTCTGGLGEQLGGC